VIRLAVEVRFSNKSPLSFTAKIEISDENGKTYIIPVSGTTDNCLFTNYPYFQRNQEKEYAFIEEEGKPLIVTENINTDSFSDSLEKDVKILGPQIGFPMRSRVSMGSIKSSTFL